MNTPSSADGSNNDYFTNHSVVVRWPFTIYHHPIEVSLSKNIKFLNTDSKSPRMKALVFGCGLFHEASLFGPSIDLTLVDSDPRLVDPIRARLKTDYTYEIVISSDPTELKTKLITLQMKILF